MFAPSKCNPYLITLPSILLYPFKLNCILIIDKRLFPQTFIPFIANLYLYMCLFHSYTQKCFIYLPHRKSTYLPKGRRGVTRQRITT